MNRFEGPLREDRVVPPPGEEKLETESWYGCRSGCPTQDHATYAECLKAARFGVAPGESAKGQF